MAYEERMYHGVQGLETRKMSGSEGRRRSSPSPRFAGRHLKLATVRHQVA